MRAASIDSSKSIVPTTSERWSAFGHERRREGGLLRPAVEPVRGLGGARDRAGQPAEGVQPPDLVGEQEQRRHRGGVVRLVLGGVVDGDRQVEEPGDPAARRLDLGHPCQGVARHHRHPEPAVGGEGLLRREVVDVGLVDVHREAAGAAGRVDEHQGVGVGAVRPLHRGHDAGGGLVVRPGVDVDAVLRLRQRQRTGGALRDHRVGEERCLGGAGGELGGELAVGAEGGAVPDQAEDRRVPERRRPAVAEDDLVAVRQVEEVAQALADLTDQSLDRGLPVRGAHDRRAVGHERLQRLRADLGRPAAEPSVGGQELGGDGDAHPGSTSRFGSVRCGAADRTGGGTTTARDRRARTRAVDTSADGAQAGAAWVMVFVVMVSKPSTSSGLRGSGPM